MTLVRALLIAAAFWHAPPHCGVPTAHYRALRPGEAGVAILSRCSILVDQRPWTDCALATVVTHEWGHLLRGRQHRPNPHSIMYRKLGPAQIRALQRRVKCDASGAAASVAPMARAPP